MSHIAFIRKTCLVSLVGLSLAGCRVPQRATKTTALPLGEATIVAVSDGDTVLVEIDGKQEHVRLIGVNTPETVKPNFPVECYGPEASHLTKSLLPKGTVIRIERDTEARDGYNRILGYVYRLEDGLFINMELARQGAGVEMSIKPNTAHAEEFHAAIVEAQAAQRGLWKACRTT
jgi:micrococcal nuclease